MFDAPAGDGGDIAVVGLVDRFHAPRAATPRTQPSAARLRRPRAVPAVHGRGGGRVPRAGAVLLGLLPPDDAPDGARRFRSPVEPVDGYGERTLYVLDDRAHRFEGNQFSLSDAARRHATQAPLPGLSFFDRPDQQDMVKVHLPYLWLTPTESTCSSHRRSTGPATTGCSC